MQLGRVAPLLTDPIFSNSMWNQLLYIALTSKPIIKLKIIVRCRMYSFQFPSSNQLKVLAVTSEPFINLSKC